MQLSANLTPSQIADIQCDLYGFTKYIFRARKGVNFAENWHHAKICEYLERVFIGDIKRLIINMPPRYSKTEIAVISFMAWAMGLYPDSEFIHASYSKRLATLNAWNTKSVIEHEAYQAIFPVQLQHDSKAKDEFRTVDGGCIYGTGAEGTITGYGAGKVRNGFGGAIVIDDPHKAGEANSETMRKNVIEWFKTTMESRVNTKDTPIIIIMQRLHEDDLSGWLLNGGNGEEWEHLNIPALDANDVPLWPFKHTYEDLKRMEAANSYVFAGQYMQNPAPVGGGIFKDVYWRYWQALPRLLYRFITVDTAQKAKTWNDWTVAQCWGVGGDGNIYLLDMLRVKEEAPEARAALRLFYKKHDTRGRELGALRYMYIEDKSSGATMIQDFKREGMKIKDVQRNTDKVSRALDTVPYIEAGRVFINADVPGVSDLLAEARGFPNASHDDTLDPLMDAINIGVVNGAARVHAVAPVGAGKASNFR
jgi:predicted phage terminase large subunit-like protein